MRPISLHFPQNGVVLLALGILSVSRLTFASDVPDSVLQSIAHLEMTASHSYSMRREVIAGNNAGDYTVDFRWRESGSRFFCDWEQHSVDGSSIKYRAAFDGQHFQTVDEDSTRTLYVSKGLNPERIILGAEEFMTSPFRFALRYLEPNNNRYPSVKSLLSPETFRVLAGMATSVETHQIVRDGKPFTEILFSGCMNKRTGESESIIVTFDNSRQFYPMSYSVYTAQGKAIMKYEVKQLSEAVATGEANVKMYFPSIAEASYFGSKKSGYSENPTFVYRYSISNFQFMQRDEDNEDEFSFNPAEFDLIYDEDTKTVISVPK